MYQRYTVTRGLLYCKSSFFFFVLIYFTAFSRNLYSMGKGNMEMLGYSRNYETHSWAERMSQAICGVCFGIILFIGSLVLLGWNEKRAVYTAQTIDYARDKYVQADSCSPSAVNDGKLVAIQGCGAAPEDGYNVTEANYLEGMFYSETSPLTVDPPQVFSWSRRVAEYVYVETSHTTKENGKTRTTYTYSEDWRTSPPSFSGGTYPQTGSFPTGWTQRSEMTATICIGNDSSSCTDGKQDSFVFKNTNTFQNSLMKKVGYSQPLAVSASADILLNAVTLAPETARYCPPNYLQTRRRGVGASCSNIQTALGSSYGDFQVSWNTRANVAGYSVSVLAEQVTVGGVTTFQAWQNPDHVCFQFFLLFFKLYLSHMPTSITSFTTQQSAPADKRLLYRTVHTTVQGNPLGVCHMLPPTFPHPPSPCTERLFVLHYRRA